MAIDKAVDSAVLDGYFTDIADAIRAKAETSDTYTPEEMPQAIADIPAGGDDLLSLLMNGTASGDIVFDCDGDVPPGLTININPTGSSPFNDQITSLSFPTATSVGDSWLRFRSSGFESGRNELKRLDFPLAEKVGEIDINIWSPFNYCLSGLTEFNAPKLQTVSRYLCKDAVSLPEIDLPSFINNIGEQAFYRCRSLKIADFGRDAVGVKTSKPGRINSNAFNGCSSLVALIVRYFSGSDIFELASTYVLANTPIASGTGYIYVPRDMVDTYKAATNWSTYANQIRAVEDYTTDGTLTGDFVLPE